MNNHASQPNHRDGATPSLKHNRKFPLVILVLVGIGVATLVSCNGTFKNWGRSLFGPPQVKLDETFDANPNGPAFDHRVLDALLKKTVDADGFIDYELLKSDQTDLDTYLKAIGAANIEQLGRDERLAFLINAYNAFTLKLISENYPLKSIKDIPDAQRWDAVRWNLAGQTVSLNQIEHQHVRPNFKEPRIHFALVCAAIGCPPLRSETFSGENLEQQLADQATFVHDHQTWFQYDSASRHLKLTQLYDWYGDDFVQVAGSVEKFAARYSTELSRDLASGKSPSISWLEYDWTLNDKLKQSPR